MGKQFYIIFFTLVLLAAGCRQRSNMPDLKETYNLKDTKPFGGYIAYHLLQQSYPEQQVQVKTKSFYNTATWINDTASLYVNISKNFYVNEEDATALLDYVYKGNTAFIAAADIDTILLDKLYCKQGARSVLEGFLVPDYATTTTSLVPALITGKDTAHSYFYLPFTNFFSEINDRYCRIVGYNDQQQPNFIVFFWGKGRFFLHCEPRAFSNYFLLQKNNYQYMWQPLQAFNPRPEHIFWDDHYNKKNYNSHSSRDRSSNSGTAKNNRKDNEGEGGVFTSPALTWAFWILLALLLLYIFFNGKRKQREIPVIKPVINSSVALAEAIGGLYFKEKNNKVIADKMINYFNEAIRSRYFLNTNIVNADFLQSLSRKAAVPLERTEILYRTMQQLGTIAEVTDSQLLDLNEQIQQFNKYKN